MLSDRLRTLSETAVSTPPGTPDTKRRADLPGTPKTPGTPVHSRRSPLEKQKSMSGDKLHKEVPNGVGKSQKPEEKKLIEAEKMETERVCLLWCYVHSQRWDGQFS